MKLGRNDSCWCGSGRKYKSCHMQMDEKIEFYHNKNHKIIMPSHDMIKTPEQIEKIRKAGEINSKVLDAVEPYVKEGVSTEKLNQVVEEATRDYGGIPACLNYEGYPKSVCTSINEVVCHGIPDENRILKNGDIINVDCTTIYDGYYGDASRMYMIGEVSEKRRRLVEVTKECLDWALEAAQPWTTFGDFGHIINSHAEENGFSVVKDIGGHGVGVDFHEDLWVPHFGNPNSGVLIVPGMTFTIEPMINQGTDAVYVDTEDGWTVYTEDNLPSAQWEYTILITENGNEILSR